MAKSAEYFLKELEQGAVPSKFLLLVGDEAFYKDKIVAKVTEVLFNTVPEAERAITVFDRDVSLEELSESINTFSIFSGDNLVILKNLAILAGEGKAVAADRRKEAEKKQKDQLEKLLAILQDLPDYAHVICLCDTLDKRRKFFIEANKTGIVVECASVKSYYLKSWLEARASEYGARFDAQAVALISDYMSLTDTVPLLILHQEIEKLALYAGERKVWGVSDVREMFASLPEVSRFALSNAVAERKLGKVLELMDAEKKKGDSNLVGLCFRVAFEIRRLCQVKELVCAGFDSNEIVSRLKMHPFSCKLAMDNVRNFELKSLRRALIQLNTLNVEKRRGGRSYERLEEILLELFIKHAS